MTYQVDPGSTYVFQVTHSDGAWFKSAESDQYRVVAGAYIVANDFSIAKTAIEKYYDEANGSYTLKADDASRNEFETNLKNWAAAGVMPSGSGMTVKVDFDTAFGAVPVEGAYEVTFYLQDTAGQKVAGSEKKVTMAVTSSGDPSVNPQAKLFASNFAVGKDEIKDSWTGMAEMNQLAWDRSNAHGTKKNGAEELALADVEVTIAPAGGSAQGRHRPGGHRARLLPGDVQVPAPDRRRPKRRHGGDGHRHHDGVRPHGRLGRLLGGFERLHRRRGRAGVGRYARRVQQRLPLRCGGRQARERDAVRGRQTPPWRCPPTGLPLT